MRDEPLAGLQVHWFDRKDKEPPSVLTIEVVRAEVVPEHGRQHRVPSSIGCCDRITPCLIKNLIN